MILGSVTEQQAPSDTSLLCPPAFPPQALGLPIALPPLEAVPVWSWQPQHALPWRQLGEERAVVDTWNPCLEGRRLAFQPPSELCLDRSPTIQKGLGLSRRLLGLGRGPHPLPRLPASQAKGCCVPMGR